MIRRVINLGSILLLAFAGLTTAIEVRAADHKALAFDAQGAIAFSQAAVNRQVSDFMLRDRKNNSVALASFRGRPTVINLVYTACSDFCPTLVQTLSLAVEGAREVFGDDSFDVVTIGFDPRGDTPSRMRAFAREQGIDMANWYFLSGEEVQIKSLADNLGFIYFPTARGFDHLAQVSILDRQGRVFHQVYGTDFETPSLVEPLRAIFNNKPLLLSDPSDLINRVRLFCTYYDPVTGTYAFDYSIFISIVVGALSVLGMAFILIRAGFRLRRERLESFE